MEAKAVFALLRRSMDVKDAERRWRFLRSLIAATVSLPTSHNLDRSKGMNLSDWTDSEGPSHLSVEPVNPLAGSDWDHLVRTHPDAGFFHSSAWAKVLAGTYQHQPFYLRFSEEEKTVALLPLFEVASTFTGRRAVCLPFSDFCSPLLFPGVESFVLATCGGRSGSGKKVAARRVSWRIRTGHGGPFTGDILWSCA